MENYEKSTKIQLKAPKSKNRSKFTEEEDFKIYILVQQYGKNWRLFSEYMNGKTPN